MSEGGGGERPLETRTCEGEGVQTGEIEYKERQGEVGEVELVDVWEEGAEAFLDGEG